MLASLIAKRLEENCRRECVLEPDHLRVFWVHSPTRKQQLAFVYVQESYIRVSTWHANAWRILDISLSDPELLDKLEEVIKQAPLFGALYESRGLVPDKLVEDAQTH